MAIDFSGTAQRLTFSSTNIDGTAQLSFSIWFNQDTTGVGRIFMLNEVGSSGFQIASGFISNRVNICASKDTGFWGDDTSSRLRGVTTVGTWHHVCGTVTVNDGGGDKTLESAFLDGVALTDTGGDSFTQGTSTDLVYVAARSDDASHFNGQVAECAIWESVQITAEEAVALANGAPVTTIQAGSLKFYTSLSEIDGVDLITGNAATKTGSPDSTEHPPITSSASSFVPTAAAPPSGRIMSSLANAGGLAGTGGIAGLGGGLAG